MIKVFTLNKNKKIELTEKELKDLLDEAYWEGYRSGSNTSWTYTTPNWTPYYYYSSTCTSSTATASNSSDSITFTNSTPLNSNN